jgi:endo-1,4-beta-xylanase
MNNRSGIRNANTAVLIGLLSVIITFGQNTETLKAAFDGKFYIGVAVNGNQILGNDPRSMEIVKTQFSSLTPENFTKWERIHPQPNGYNFAVVDSFVAFGEREDMFMVGHCLVWNVQTPAWVFRNNTKNLSDRDALLANLKDHIYTVVGRYRGKIDGWDVVNEAFHDNGESKKTRWYKIIGEDYIEQAFRWAHAADPEAELYYNDYNMYVPEKRDAVVKLVKKLQAKGVPIHGIGMQGHWGLKYPTIEELEAAIVAYGNLGLSVHITELDINILPDPFENRGADIGLRFRRRKALNPYPDALPDSMHVMQSRRYAEIFEVFNKHSDIVERVTLWGVHDGLSWRNYWPIRGRTAYPLLFDRNYRPKSAFFAVINTVKDE